MNNNNDPQIRTYGFNQQQNNFSTIYKVFRKRLENVSAPLHVKVKMCKSMQLYKNLLILLNLCY